MALTLSAIDSSWEFWGGACRWRRRLVDCMSFDWCWWKVSWSVWVIILCLFIFWPALCFDVWRWCLAVSSTLFWDGISQAPTVPEVRVRPGATIPFQLTSVQLLMWRKRSPFVFASVDSEMPGLPLTSLHFSLMMRIFVHSNGRLCFSSTCSALDDVCIHTLYRTDARANALRQAFVYFCQMTLLLENCYVNTFLNDLYPGPALFGHVAMAQDSWMPPKYHNVVARGSCLPCSSLIIASITRFSRLPAVERHLPILWCLCWRGYKKVMNLHLVHLGFSDLIVDLLRRRPAGQWSFDLWS